MTRTAYMPASACRDLPYNKRPLQQPATQVEIDFIGFNQSLHEALKPLRL